MTVNFLSYMMSVAGGLNNTFNPVIQFATTEDMGIHTVTEPITLSIDDTDQEAGNYTTFTLIADGVNVPDISAFTLANWSSGYDNTEDAENHFEILFDGTYYWLGIYQ